MITNKHTIILLTLLNVLLTRGEHARKKDDSNEATEQKTNEYYEDEFLESSEAEEANSTAVPETVNYSNETTAYEDSVETSTSLDYITPESNAVYDEGEVFNSTYYDEKVETTSQATTIIEEEENFTTPPEVEEDSTVQRNPKTESSEQPPVVGRQFNNAPAAVPASKSSTLKSWLEDSWLRQPAAVLVPLRPMAINRALAVWNELNAEGLNVSDIVIVGYDSNGINWRSRHNLQSTVTAKDRDVTEALSKLLLKYQGVHSDTASDGTMRALASAAKLVPYDSALFVITDKGAGDPQRLPLALRNLVEKRLKVYTIWTNPIIPTSDENNELQELRNISQHTEGEVLPYSMQVMDIEGASNLAAESEVQPWTPADKQGRHGRLNGELENYRYDTLLLRRGGGEAISLGLIVENGVTALRILIEGAVEHAVLYPPNDAPQIDLYDTESVSSFSPESRTDNLSPRDVYLILPGSNNNMDTLAVLPANPESQPGLVGKWHLSVRCDTCDYRLCVMARAQIHLDVTTDGTDMLKLRLTGPVAGVRESLVVDEYGTELATLPFSYQPMVGDDPLDVGDLTSELVADVVLPSVKGNKIYVKIIGRDVSGEPFVRLAGPLNQPEVRNGRSAAIVFPDSVNDLERAENENLKRHDALRSERINITASNRIVSQVMNQRGTLLTAVQIGLSTTLYGEPGDNLQLHFEVTNYREQSERFTFGAQGELRLLTGISPVAQTLGPGQMVNVIVSATIPTNTQPGTRVLITFTAYGPQQVSISAYVYVINVGETIFDTLAPEVSHAFQGSCIGRTGQDCAQYVWSTTVTARDGGSGLLRLASSPIGLMYDNFIAGTRDSITATYRATCCAPRMLLNAVDALGNTNSYIIDISGYLSETAIAAIVLGIILAILLIALTVYLISLCVKRRKESRELPYSTSSRNIS